MALGATLTDGGCAFAVYVDPAPDGVTLWLVDSNGADVVNRVDLQPGADEGVWQADVPGVAHGQRYGYRIHRPDDPTGVGADDGPLLLDPYARAFAPTSSAQPRRLHSMVIAPTGPPDPCRRRPLADTVIYETHVKGITRLRADVNAAARGTFRGLASPTMTGYLRNLGVTAVELMPVHQFVSEQFLLDDGITDYWGYASVGFFAPHGAYSAAGPLGGQVAEFKAMVSALHQVGIEVILDVVFNHTGEGGPTAPPLSFRGLANGVYYWLDPAAPGKYVDVTGTGNTLDAKHPRVIDLIIDSLTYWVDEMGVDGFRFDEAGALAREEGGFEGGSSPFCRRVQAFADQYENLKLIAEPWDLSLDHGRLGGFPDGWREWNAEFRDGVPAFWNRSIGLKWPGGAGLGDWLTGSADVFTDRAPLASVNFAACHDGLTAADKVALAADMAFSSDLAINTEALETSIFDRRRRRQRNLIATVLVSQGVPMLLGGDELGRSQDGNGNAYDQDNPVSWYDWAESPAKVALQAFVTNAVKLRSDLAALRRPALLEPNDSAWYALEGQPMSQADWDDQTRHGVAFWIAGTGAGDPDVFVIMNADTTPSSFTFPSDRGGWQLRLDTSVATGTPAPGVYAPGESVAVPAETLLVATSH